MEQFSWYITALILLANHVSRYGGLENVPISIVLVICTMILCGSIISLKGKSDGKERA